MYYLLLEKVKYQRMKVTNFYQKPLSLLLLFTIYILSVSLLFFKFIPYESRNLLLLVLGVLLAGYCVLRNFKRDDLGITKKHLKNSLLLNGLYSLIVIIPLYIFYKLDLIRKPTIPDYDWFFIFYVFISCPIQEFLYRSIIYAEFNSRRIDMKYFIIISALNYSLLHSFYYDVITLVSTFIGGLCWGYIYCKYPNFWGVALSHALLGAVSIAVGLI